MRNVFPLLLILSACGPSGPGLKSLNVGGLELDLESGRRYFAVAEGALGRTTRVVAKARGDVTLRWETASGEVIEENAPTTLELRGDQRLVIELDDGKTVESWLLAVTPPDLPPVSATGQPDDLFFFLGPRDFTVDQVPWVYNDFVLIIDSLGTPVWWRRTDYPAFDFRLTGEGLFTVNTRFDGDQDTHSYLLDPRSGQTVMTWVPEEVPDGWDTVRVDAHEFYLRDDGAILRTVTGNGTEDLSPVGGAVDGKVWHSAVQQLSPSGETDLWWETWGYIDLPSLPDAVIETEADGAAWRYGHINSVEADEEGALLSLRSPNQVVKVSRDTGEVLWKVGGHDSDFTFVDDPRNGFVGQHSARMFDPDLLTVFDNGTNFYTPTTGDVRVVEYALDHAAGTATRTWEYAVEGAGGTDFAGLVQRLDDGRTFVGWGSTQNETGGRGPSMTLLGEDHLPQLEFRLPEGAYTYRAYAFEGDPIRGEWVPAAGTL